MGKTTNDLKFTIGEASRVYKDLSNFMKKHERTIADFNELNTAWEAIKAGLNDFVPEIKQEGLLIRNEILEVTKKKDGLIIMPMERYPEQYAKDNPPVDNLK